MGHHAAASAPQKCVLDSALRAYVSSEMPCLPQTESVYGPTATPAELQRMSEHKALERSAVPKHGPAQPQPCNFQSFLVCAHTFRCSAPLLCINCCK